MITLKKIAAAALLTLGFSGVAEAAPVLGGGWFFDEITNVAAPSAGSPYDFTLVGPAWFRITDGFIIGDTYQVFDGVDLILTTSFQGFGAGFGDNVGADIGWTSADFGSAEILLAAGSYSLSVIGDGFAGTPSGFYTRLDPAAVIPLPAALPLLLAGLGGLVIVGRRRAA